MKPRSAVILIENDRIALIERYRAGLHYLAFPGGRIHEDETPAAAAQREALEELGLEVSIGRMVAEVWYKETPQYYFLAQTVSGLFGSGTGKEMSSSADSVKGSHQPVWLPVDEITSQSVLPSLVASFVQASHQHGWPLEPLTIKYQIPNELK